MTVVTVYAGKQESHTMDYHPGWLLVVLGLVIATIGLVWLLAPSVPWFGRLPGDIVIERGNSRFYFPLTT